MHTHFDDWETATSNYCLTAAKIYEHSSQQLTGRLEV